MKNRKWSLDNWNAPKIFSTIFSLAFLLLYARFAFLALATKIDGKNIKEFAANRNTTSSILYANRGSIYDSEGNALAINVSSYTVIAYLSPTRTGNSKKPLHVVDKEKTAEALSPLINMSKETILNLLNKNLYQVELGPGGRGITELTKEKIEELELPGIAFTETYKRYYPNGNFASYTLGYAKSYEEKNDAGILETNIVGELGVEKKYNELLTGTNGYLSYQKDRFNYKIPDTKEIRVDEKDGLDIYLTLDSNIQRFLESANKVVEEKYNPEWFTLSVMDADTGAIVGTTASPSFDPNYRDIKNYENVLVSSLYEPGSVMKVFTYMCALESGKYKGKDTFLSGKIQILDNTVKDWNDIGWGYITYDKGFEYSSNVGISNIVQNVIDRETLKDCFLKYGFASSTGIELPREADGVINFTYPIEVATAGFGQGIYTTAIQMLQGLSIVANDGKMLSPYIVDKIVDPNTKEVKYQSQVKESEQLVSTKTVDYIKDLMYNVVNSNDPNRTGKNYHIEGYDLLGKTGTAQIFDVKTNKYLTGHYDVVYSFAGIFPKEDPKYIIYAAVKRPDGGGSYILPSLVPSVIKNIAKYKNIYNEAKPTDKITTYEVKPFTNQKVETVEKLLKSKGIDVIVIGSGDTIINQYPLNKTIVSNDKVFLLTNGEDVIMPDMFNWSKNDVRIYKKLTNFNIIIDGNGYVVSQSIMKGEKISIENEINITLKNKEEVEVEEKESNES